VVVHRFNTMASEQTGITLQFLPMLVGFFTYKAAVVAKQSLVLLGELTGSSPQQPSAQPLSAEGSSPKEGGVRAQPAAASPTAQGDAASSAEARRREVDRLFNNRVLSG
jgi:hypothetical protein